jgi:hypothetical protein
LAEGQKEELGWIVFPPERRKDETECMMLVMKERRLQEKKV